MGIGFVLAIYAIFGLILASVSSLALLAITIFFTRELFQVQRTQLLVYAAALPFFSLGWAGGRMHRPRDRQ